MTASIGRFLFFSSPSCFSVRLLRTKMHFVQLLSLAKFLELRRGHCLKHDLHGGACMYVCMHVSGVGGKRGLDSFGNSPMSFQVFARLCGL